MQRDKELYLQNAVIRQVELGVLL